MNVPGPSTPAPIRTLPPQAEIGSIFGKPSQRVARAAKGALPYGAAAYGVAGTALAVAGSLSLSSAIAASSVVAACAFFLKATYDYFKNQTNEARQQALEAANMFHREIGRCSSVDNIERVTIQLRDKEENYKSLSLVVKYRELTIICYAKRKNLLGGQNSTPQAKPSFVSDFESALSTFNQSWFWSADRDGLSSRIASLRHNLLYDVTSENDSLAIAIEMTSVYNSILRSGKNQDLIDEVFSIICECWDYYFLKNYASSSSTAESDYIV